MAVDSREKRQTVVHVSLYAGPNMTPNAAKDVQWRIEAGYGYPGFVVGVGEIMDWFSTGTYIVGKPVVKGY